MLIIEDLDLPSDWAVNEIEQELNYIENDSDTTLVEDRVIEIGGLPVRMIFRSLGIYS